MSQRTFLNDAGHVWNNAPDSLKKCNSLYSVKKAIKLFVETLPLVVYTSAFLVFFHGFSFRGVYS